MKIFSDEELEEIPPLKESDDKGLVKTPERKGGRPSDKETRDDIIKAIIAEDVKELGKDSAAIIHGVSPSSALRYSHGEGIKDPDIRAGVIAQRHGIENIAVAKLMDTLEMLDPGSIEKEVDKIKVMTGLATVIEKITGGQSKGSNVNVVQLELHMPNQKKESDYETITVSR